MSTHPDAWKSWWKTLAGALQVNDIRSEHPYRSTNDIDSSLMHSECSFSLKGFTRSAFVARFSTYIVFFLFNMSQAKTKHLVHPLLGKSERSLPWEIYSAFLVAQVEIDLVCKCLDNIKLTMDDLKKACDESSKETTPVSMYGTLILRLLYASTVSEKVIEKNIQSRASIGTRYQRSSRYNVVVKRTALKYKSAHMTIVS